MVLGKLIPALLLFVCTQASALKEDVNLDADALADLDALDETSLLQLDLRLPSTATVTASDVNVNVNVNVPHQSTRDIPEGPNAWALFQTVQESTTVETLSNVTANAPPGKQVGDAAPMAFNNYDAYFSPTTDQNTPPSIFNCLGNDFDPQNYTSWRVLKVTSPQLVPFVVPMDQPGRSDVSVIIAPGGGGRFLAWQSEGTDVAKALNKLGISAFVLKYRVPAPAMWAQAEAVKDAERAIRLVRHFAPSVGLNQSRIGMFGASHGGWLAFMTAVASRPGYPRQDAVDDHSPKPDFLLLNYPGLPGDFIIGKSVAEVAGTVKESIFKGVTVGSIGHLPPTFIAAGADDGCVTPALMYTCHAALKTSGNTNIELNVYKDFGHGFSTCYRTKEGGLKAMQRSEACMWMFHARRFIAWNVEQQPPSDVEAWYRTIAPPGTLETHTTA